MLDVCLLGTGGMMPLPGRHLTSLIIRQGGHSVLVDAGEGTQVAIRKYAWTLHSIDTICFTHVHGDHVAGISGLLSSMGSEGRTEPVHIIGPSHIMQIIASICVVVTVPFDVIFHEIPDMDLPYDAFGLQITPFKVQHNITCYGYRFDLPRRPKFQPDKAQALGIPLPYWSRLQRGEKVRDGLKVYKPEDVLGPPRKGISLVYSTDTRPCANLEEAAQGVDLLITEGIYGDPDKAQSAVEKHHMTMQEAAALAGRAQAKETWLTHYSPSFCNQKQYKKELQTLNPTVTFGYDGRSTVLDFDDSDPDA